MKYENKSYINVMIINHAAFTTHDQTMCNTLTNMRGVNIAATNNRLKLRNILMKQKWNGSVPYKSGPWDVNTL